MADPIHVTEAESVVLDALWTHGPLPFATLIDEVKAAQPWGDATVKTLLHRLMRKGIVSSEKADGRQRYRHLVDRRAYVDSEVQALVDRLFGGDRSALAQHLAEPG